MKKRGSSFLLSICLCLILTSGWLLFTPITALAAMCIAECAGGQSVTCRGQSCTATDGVGCTGTIDDKVTENKCPKEDEDLEIQ